MSLNFSIIIHVRNQFGTEDLNIGVFAGTEKKFMFDCAHVDPAEHALIMFQSRFVNKEQIMEINGTTVFGGIPKGASINARTIGFPISFTAVDDHDHQVLSNFEGWIGNTMVVNKGILREAGNTLKIKSSDDSFLIDNLTILFKVKQSNLAAGEVFVP